ncbi:MAG: response regulator transcription factor [Marivibrio sp.]|uniref:response regulator transcription factor n=1 Tax=Marivibrio sp. TaxID=2039719 RepID=UPI0032ECE1FD
MRLLLVEDDAALADRLATTLTQAGYAVDRAADGVDAAHLGETEPYQLIVLDLGLPGLDGLSVLKQWRAGGLETPVLVLTARSAWTDKVEGIDAGADDYLAKPFQPEELLARLRALARRAHGQANPVLERGRLRLDPRAASVTLDGAPVTLTAQEYRLLHHLMLNPERTVSRTELTEQLYAQDFDRDSNTIEVFVARLRRKLGSEVIETARGLGYRLGATR